MKTFSLLAIVLFSFFQVKFEKVSLPGNKASLMAPNSLARMSDSGWVQKYQKRPRPELVMTDKNGEVNFIGDMTKQAVTEEQLASFQNFQVAQLKKGKAMKVLEESVKTINGKKVGVIKFISELAGQKIFNYYFFTIVDGKILFFTFNCLEKLRGGWEKTADQMLASLKTK